MDSVLKRTWAVVHLDNIAANYEYVSSFIQGKAKVMAVLKADAYGHGALQVARRLRRCGLEYIAVSNIDEALELRAGGIELPILVLSYTPEEHMPLLAEYGITQTVCSLRYAQEVSDAGLRAGKKITVHLKLDTGMSRLGIMCQQPEQFAAAADEAERICRLPGLYAQGIFTHFSMADSLGSDYTLTQFSCFMEVLERLSRKGIVFEQRHCANSAAALRYPEMQLDLIRPGIVLYGSVPSEDFEGQLRLKPAMELKSAIYQIRELDGGAVSYGRRYRVTGRARIATIPAGYADGLPRILTNNGDILVCGRPANICGTVCMDHIMVDVTDIPEAREGQTVTIFGHDGDGFIPVEHIASAVNTISYEILSGIGKRVHRLYMEGGEEVK